MAANVKYVNESAEEWKKRRTLKGKKRKKANKKAKRKAAKY